MTARQRMAARRRRRAARRRMVKERLEDELFHPHLPLRERPHRWRSRPRPYATSSPASSLSTTIAAVVVDHLRGGRPRDPPPSPSSTSSARESSGATTAVTVLVVVISKPHCLHPDLASSRPSLLAAATPASLRNLLADFLSLHHPVVVDHLRGGRPRDPPPSPSLNSSARESSRAAAVAVLVVVIGEPHSLHIDLASSRPSSPAAAAPAPASTAVLGSSCPPQRPPHE
uniref:Uncharacterized protein n=1 Tax=Oryza nivara TaxID=4536 RepID=A0A0E0I8C0_ORYNI